MGRRLAISGMTFSPVSQTAEMCPHPMALAHLLRGSPESFGSPGLLPNLLGSATRPDLGSCGLGPCLPSQGAECQTQRGCPARICRRVQKQNVPSAGRPPADQAGLSWPLGPCPHPQEEGPPTPCRLSRLPGLDTVATGQLRTVPGPEPVGPPCPQPSQPAPHSLQKGSPSAWTPCTSSLPLGLILGACRIRPSGLFFGTEASATPPGAGGAQSPRGHAHVRRSRHQLTDAGLSPCLAVMNNAAVNI